MKKKLTQKAVEHAKPGKHYDDHGLILTVRPSGSKYWFWRGTVRGKRTDLGVGAYPYVSLAEARNIAFQYRKLSKAGQDPRVNRSCPTFANALETVIALHRRTWKPGGGSEQQWRSELGKHAIPRLGGKRVDEITTSDVMAVLTTDHLWTRRPAIAKRVRQRIGAVMKWAIARGHRGDNPAGDAIGAALPKSNGRKTHYKALPHAEVSQAIVQVRDGRSWAGIKLAFEYLVLTAARPAEVRLATWDEIDLRSAMWTVPASRMKADRKHQVPLADRAMEILRETEDLFGGEGLLFPGPRGQVIHSASIYSMLRRQGIQTTLHGFRASFRTWCGDTGQPRELAEASLAHVIPNSTAAAYARGTMFERRQRLMQDWAVYLAARDS